MAEAQPGRRGISRRAFLAATAASGTAAILGGVGGAALSGAGRGSVPAPIPPVGSVRAETTPPFLGQHQAGVTRPPRPQAEASFVAFDVVAKDRASLALAFRELSERARLLTDGWTPDQRDPNYPPLESGVLGASVVPSGVSITVAVGASLFDDRFGLSDRKPRRLARMPVFPNDVIDPALAHGDLLVQVCGPDRETIAHAVRYLMLGTRDTLVLRWVLDGFQRPGGLPGPGPTTRRNLMGFRDGTANLDPTAEATMNELVWVADGDEPAWATGGTYMVVRTIRMFVERWDRTSLGEQERIIGRSKVTGAPLGSTEADADPEFATDPDGARMPLDAHIRLANPRTAATQSTRILRRGYNFSRGFDAAGLLDQGLIFVCFQRDLELGFASVQARLNGEPLEEYIRTVGGGYFFALPGVGSEDRFLGDTLLA